MLRVFAGVLVGALTVFGAAACSKKTDAPAAAVGAAAGKVVEITGKVTATRDGKPRDLAVGAEVFRDDEIATADDATVTIELFHNGAKWAVVSNKTARVDASLAWGLDKQEASNAAEHNSASAGRHAERSAAETGATAAMDEAPGAVPAPAASAAPPAESMPPPPPPPPPPPAVGGAASREAAKADQMATESTRPKAAKEVSAPRRVADQAAASTPQELAERQRPALKKCLDGAGNVSLAILVRDGKATLVVQGTVSDEARACMDAIVQNIKWPAGATRVVLKLD